MAVQVNIDWRSDLPDLSGARAVLREPTAGDIGALAAVLSVADAGRFGLDGAVDQPSLEAFVACVRQQREAGVALTCVVVDRQTGTIVGLIRVKRLDPAFEGAECDCTLLPAARGTGIFGEVASLVESFAFEVAGAHRLEARALSANARANAALKKAGGVQEGVLRRAIRRDGAYADQVLWSLLKDDWVAARRRQPPRDQ